MKLISGYYNPIAIVVAVISSVLAGCTPTYERPIFEAGNHYTALIGGQPVFTTVSPKGMWDYSEKWRKDGMFMVGGGTPFKAVGYSARIILENVMKGNSEYKKDFLWKLRTGRYQEAVDNKLKNFYTERHNKIVGVSSVSGSVVEIAGLTCTRFEEVQNYGPPAEGQLWSSLIRVLRSSTSCPVAIDGELWGFYYSYRISIANEEFYTTYGPSAPTDATLIGDIEARLKPMLEQMEFHRPISQNYNDLNPSIRAWYEANSQSTQK
jgi:hypothetical protein